MKIFLAKSFLLTAIVFFVFACSEDSSSPDNTLPIGSVKAFDNAEGGGMYATGGRGGAVYFVTSLQDDLYGSIPGTLRYALKQSGTRMIVFKVAGTIDLKSKLTITNGSFTLAGQSAPGRGITVKGYPVYLSNVSNVIIRFVRFRMGDEHGAEVQDDALGAQGCSNVIIDHCSMSWSTDECGSFYNNKNFTLQWCILSESLRNSVHDKGKHGYGGIWGGNNASFHHNLLADHDSRNPRFDHDCISSLRGPIDFVNNVIYNWGMNSSYGGENRTINLVNNYYKAGSATSYKNRIFNPANSTSLSPFCDAEINKNGKYYVDGNYVYGYTDASTDNWGIGVQGITDADKLKFKVAIPFSVSPVTAQTAENAYESVMGFSGASLSRDTVDIRIIYETRNCTYTYTGSKGSTGGLIDSQADVGGWPEEAGVIQASRPAGWDSDYDGIPDTWEDANGLNKNLSSDAKLKTLDPNGQMTNLEIYLNSLVSHLYPN